MLQECVLTKNRRNGIMRMMKLTAVFEPAPEGGYTCWVEEIPAAISEGETLEEAQANLMEATQLVIECQRELSEQSRSPRSVKQTFELAAA
jgi:predicted RNase H-like HicB family nuclease